MKTTETYYTFNDRGETHFPLNKEITDLEKVEIHPVLLLDSCVCLDLVKFVNYKKKTTIDKIKLKNYLEYIKSLFKFSLLEIRLLIS